MMMVMSLAREQQLADEERLLSVALQESLELDLLNQDVDNMTYEQLLEMGDTAGKVSKGLTPS